MEMEFWLPLVLVLVAIAACRYGVDSRDGRDSNPFDPGVRFPTPRRPTDGPARPRRTHTVLADLAALRRAVVRLVRRRAVS